MLDYRGVGLQRFHCINAQLNKRSTEVMCDVLLGSCFASVVREMEVWWEFCHLWLPLTTAKFEV